MTENKKIFTIVALFFLVAGIVLSFDPLIFPDSGVVMAEDKDADGKKAKDGDSEGKEGEQEVQPCPECPECPDAAKIVLRGLEEKKLAVEAAGKVLDQERKELETYEAQIDEKLASLTALKKQINDDMALLTRKKSQKELDKEAAFETKMARLVKMYAGMKPKAAAQIVDKMELEVAQEIFLRMREASASQILAFVDSAKAAKISERLAFKKK